MGNRLMYARGALSPTDAASAAREADVLATEEGMFETLLVMDGVARDVRAHVDRLLAAADLLNLTLRESPAELLDVVRAVASAVPTPWARLRLTAFERRSEVEVLVMAAPYVPPSPTTYARGVQVTRAKDLRVDRVDESRQVKSLAWRRHGEVLLQADPGSFDVLLLNDAGRLAEGARSNVVVRRGGIAVTPPLSEGCLPGTVRHVLVQSGAVHEGELDVSEVLSGSEMVLTNSLVGVIPVARVDGRRCDVVGLASELRVAWEQSRP